MRLACKTLILTLGFQSMFILQIGLRDKLLVKDKVAKEKRKATTNQENLLALAHPEIMIYQRNSIILIILQIQHHKIISMLFLPFYKT